MLSAADVNIFMTIVEMKYGGNVGVYMISLHVLISPCNLRSGTSVKTYFTLRSDTVSDGVACGGIVSIILMVYAILNSAFLVGYPASN